MSEQQKSAAWGNVLRGVAIGDAWGAPNEFRSIGELTRQSRLGPVCPERLEVTDDTQMTLYLARALSATVGHSVTQVQQAIATQFVAYTHDPDFAGRAPGITVTNSLARLESGLPWTQATDDYSDGCGTVMRTSPVAFTADRVGIAAFAAAITHGTANAIATAILNTELLHLIVNAGRNALPGHLSATALDMARRPDDYGLLDTGVWLDGLTVDLAEGFDALATLLRVTTTALQQGYAADPWAFDPCLAGGEGWRAHECLATALLCADAFPEDGWLALRRAVTTGGDSDSIGAVAGGLLGALHGPFWPEGTLDRLEPRYQAEIAAAAQLDFA